MPFWRWLGMMLNNPQLIERLSETKPIRRAAQITVGLYKRISAGGITSAKTIEGRMKDTIKDFADAPPKSHGFLSRFQQELSNEHDKMKRDGKL